MAKIKAFLNNAGETVFRGSSGFGRSAERALAAYKGQAHIRIGRFSVILTGTGDVIAAPVYADAEFFSDADSSYLECLASIAKRLRATHPHCAALKADVKEQFTSCGVSTISAAAKRRHYLRTHR